MSSTFAFNASNYRSYRNDALLASEMNLGPGGKQPFMRETFIHQIGRLQLLVWPDTPAIAIHLRGKKGIMQVLSEIPGLKIEDAVLGLISFFSVRKTQTDPGATWTSKESLGAVHAVCWQRNRTLKSKRADYRRNWSVVDSWLSFIQSFTVNSISLSGTSMATSVMPEKIVSTHQVGRGKLYQQH